MIDQPFDLTNALPFDRDANDAGRVRSFGLSNTIAREDEVENRDGEFV